MRKICILALVVLALPMFSYATVLTFGPACSGNCVIQVPLGYGGFAWTAGFYAIGNSYYDNNYGNTYGAPSGGAAFNASGGSPIGMNSTTPFFFSGADVSSFAENDAYSYQGYSSVTLTIDAYDALSNHIGSVTATLSPTGYNFVIANFATSRRLYLLTIAGRVPDAGD
jgi:hypothetical protein